MFHLAIRVSFLTLFVAALSQPALAATGRFEITVVDKETGRPVPCRMHLVGPKKKPFKPDKVPYWHDHFALPGKLVLKLPTGHYTFVVERGLEYLDQSGSFTIETFADDSKQIELRRFADMAADGWWSGDLDVERPQREIELLMEADDLHVAELIAWRNNKPSGSPFAKEPLLRFDGNRFCNLAAGAWARPGTELLLLRAAEPLKAPPDAESPTIARLLADARQKGNAWIDASRPYWWDLPMLVAAGEIDSIEVAHSNFCREKAVNDEGSGKPRDRRRYASYKGNAEWSQEIYFRLLECGLRIPPSAGSGSGAAPNPVGYNRVYAHIDGELTYEKWWQALRAGQVFITNGPLMKVSVQGELPGHVFRAEAGGNLELEINLTLSTRDPISYLEIVKNGRVEREVRFDEYAKSGKLPPLRFDQSGWFLLRAVTDVPKTYRFAMSGPYFVEIGGKPRISRSAAQFFLDWIGDRAGQIKSSDVESQKELLSSLQKARDFWRELLAKANAE
jgi:hypothetical protein